MERLQTIIIGGGAAGLTLAATLSATQKNVLILERNDRLGKKLSATGNGQGNVTHIGAANAAYFSVSRDGGDKAERILKRYDDEALREDLRRLGVWTIADERGRVYPAGRQASSLTDALRFFLAEQGVEIRLGARVASLRKEGASWCVAAETADGMETFYAENVALCTGGKAARNFGTDGSSYVLATALSHSVTALYPSLVQLKTDTTWIKTLKGIRIHDGIVTLLKNGRAVAKETGDIIFTDYGVSGDAIFRISAFLDGQADADKTMLSLDLLPALSLDRLSALLEEKRARFPHLPNGELLSGILNNQVGRAVMKRADGDVISAAKWTKAFSMEIKGSLGFDYAQVTKGGVPLSETDEILQSRYEGGLYFAGEILDVDGQCGGYNLQWAYASAKTVAQAILRKGRGQVCE